MAILYKLGRDDITLQDDYSLNVYTEFLGIAATVFIVNVIYRHLDNLRSEELRQLEFNENLIRRTRSSQPAEVRSAFHEMYERELVFGKDSIVRGINFVSVEPEDVTLDYANLVDSNLALSNFSDSAFRHADLENVSFKYADLSNADLSYSNMRNVDLEHAKLSNAILTCADLRGSNLINADLEFANTYIHWLNDPSEIRANPEMFTQLILPDGTQAEPDTDTSRFTDPNHPDFWRSNDPQSPAYIGLYERRE